MLGRSLSTAVQCSTSRLKVSLFMSVRAHVCAFHAYVHLHAY